MAFIQTIPEDQADGLLRDLYEQDKKKEGYVPNYARAFSLHPEAYEKWKAFIGEVRSKMRLRRYELITFAAAMAMECTY